MKSAPFSEHKIGPFEYGEAVECIIRFALALTNLKLQKRFSIDSTPRSVGHGFYQIILRDSRPDEPKPQELTKLEIVAAENAGYAKPKTQYYEAFGERKTLGRWAQVAGVSRPTLKARVDAGMTVEEAITEIALKKAARMAS